MGFFPEAVAAYARGDRVDVALLAHFDFATTPKRVHEGFGPLVAGGQTWDGLGGLGSVSSLERAIGATAPVTTFALSGVDRDLLAASLDRTEYKGRKAYVYLQFYMANLAPLDAPLLIYRGIMARLTSQWPEPDTRTLRLEVETRWSLRGVPRWGWLSDRDQQRMYPGDLGLSVMPEMASRSRPWSPERS